MTAGLVAAGAMSAVRLLAHRAGLIDRMLPQILEERVAGAAGVEASGDGAGHQLASEAIHQAVSVAAGGALGAVIATPRLVTGIAYGLGIWLVDALGLLPALRVHRVGGGAVDAVAHAIFGAALALAMQELTTQPRLRPTARVIPLRGRVG